MDISNLLRNIFGIPDSGTHGNSRPFGPRNDEFRKPIWNLDEEDDDDDDFRRPGKPFSFQVFTNPLEMHRFFEHTMGEIVRGFEKHISDMEGQLSDADIGSGYPTLEPPESASGKENLRDQYLKPEFRVSTRPTLDEDLDEKIKSGGLDSIVKSPRKFSLFDQSGAEPFFSRSSSSKSWHLQSFNGKVETRSTMTDSQGNQTTTLTRKLGDQSYAVTSKVDPNGVEIRTENFVNIDGDDLPNFNKQWENIKVLPNLDKPKTEEPKLGQDWFPWDKLF